MLKHWALGLILCTTAVIYFPIATANYCGFDDIIELDRISNLKNPSLYSDMMEGFSTYKYRPFSSAINRWTYEFGHAQPLPFRTRNVLFHLLNTILVYGIAGLLFESTAVSALSALLFSLHPFSNQCVVGAVWTTVLCCFFALLSVYLFLRATHRPPGHIGWLIASTVVGGIGLFMYDADLYVFPLAFCWVVILWLVKRSKPFTNGFLWATIVLLLVCAAPYFIMRAIVLPPGHANPYMLSYIITNVVWFTGAPFVLIDPVLASDVFGIPLPGEALRGEMTLGFIAVTFGPALLLLMLGTLFPRYLIRKLRAVELAPLLFLVVAIPGSLAVFAIFGRLSETYMYMAMCYLAILGARLIAAIASGRALAAVVVVILCLYVPALWDRNSRVIACGEQRTRILNELPAKAPAGEMLLATPPDEPTSRYYGMYGYKGIDSLGVGEYGGRAVQAAIRMKYGNPDLQVNVVSSDELRSRCANQGPACFWVYADGRVEAFHP